MSNEPQNKVNKLQELHNDTLIKVEDKVIDLVKDRGLDFPENYSPINALKSGWLEIVDLEYSGKPVTEACSKISIINSMLDMVMDGLNPAKEQGYFIPKSGELNWWPSYFGYEAIARRVAPVDDIYKEIVWKGDEYKLEYRDGQQVVATHNTDPTNWSYNEDDILFAYAVLKYSDGRPDRYEMMNMKQIKQSWQQGDLNGKGPAHKNFPNKMAKRTIVKSLLNPIINAGDDRSLNIDQIKRAKVKRDTAQEEQEPEAIDVSEDQEEQSQEEVQTEDQESNGDEQNELDLDEETDLEKQKSGENGRDF